MNNNQNKQEYYNYSNQLFKELFKKIGLISLGIFVIGIIVLFNVVATEPNKTFSLFSMLLITLPLLQFPVVIVYIGIESTRLARKKYYGGNTKKQLGDRAQMLIGFFVVLVIIVFFVLLTHEPDNGKKWSDLSDVEKENARWAYEANEYINSLD